jgi:hypothetical protein
MDKRIKSDKIELTLNHPLEDFLELPTCVPEFPELPESFQNLQSCLGVI